MKAMGDQCAYQERPSSSKTLTLSDVNNRLQSLEVKVQGDPHLRRNVADTPLASGSSTVIPVLMEQSASHQSHDAAEETIYGPSSNISFLQEVIQLQDPEMDTTQPAQSSACPNERTMPDLLGFTEVQSPSLAHDVDLVSLPDRQLADTLFRCFWDFIHPVFPILHRPSIATMLSATTFGRPVLHCRPHTVPLPEPIDDEYLSEVDEGCQPEDSPSRITFFVYNMKLFEILDDILSKFYSHGYQNFAQDEPVKSAQYLSDIPRLCSELDHFLEGTVEDESASCFHMQAMILKSRVLYIRLLLLRPSILIETRRSIPNQRPINNNTTVCLQRSYLREINRLCVSTCHEVLEEIHRNLGSLRQTSAWHTLLFTFGAASTLLAASLCPDLEVNLDFDPAKTSWERALQIFEFHKSHVQSAAKGIKALVRYRLRFSTLAKQDQFIDSSDGHIADSMPFDGAPAVYESWLTGMTDDFNEFFTSDSLEQSWLSSQSIDWAM
ncbi:hypothetical protein QWA68_012498 [Fusarium oxysporum]|nr:hypothetical protein QWA68_012498 [Fusarium oxysporum]